MINIQDPSQCCGCTACYAKCNHNAIDMRPDALGFLYPHVDPDKCMNCGQCDNVCAFYGRTRNNETLTIDAYAVRHKEENQIRTSRSGAVFIALSDWVLNQGGVVYGVGFHEGFKVAHKRATTSLQRDEFKGSKYAQSAVGDIFVNVKRDLSANLIVLFSGTPCQVDGLKSFLGEKASTPNLYLLDIVCHGVGSPAVWKDYISYLEKKENQRIRSLSFRDKALFGWNGLHKESFVFEDGKKRTYQYTYYGDVHLRQSCYVCPYANLKRVSDITIGDLWGWERVCSDWPNAVMGISLTLCNSEKGKRWFTQVQSMLELRRVSVSDVLQHNLLKPTALPVERVQFEKDYSKYGFRYVLNKYGEVGFKFYINRIMRLFKRILKH